MILTLVTQIKLDVTFGYDYEVVSLTVHNHVINEYDMLYNPILYLHT